MAIDTEDKRRSVHGYTMTPIYPVADGSVDTQDRPHIAWIYSGLTIATSLPVLVSWTLFGRAITWTIENRDIGWSVNTRSTAWTLEDRPE